MRISILFRQEQHLPGNALIKEEKEMAVGNRVFLKRNLPDNYLVEEFKQITGSKCSRLYGTVMRHESVSD